MDTAEIIRLMEAVKQNGISVLEVSEGNMRLRLERNTDSGYTVTPVAVQPHTTPIPDSDTAKTEAAEAYKNVDSPLVGIYHPVDESKGVKIGAFLKKGSVVCIVEAMKLMNEITIPEDGELVWLAAKDGDAVEYGQTLFQYK